MLGPAGAEAAAPEEGAAALQPTADGAEAPLQAEGEPTIVPPTAADGSEPLPPQPAEGADAAAPAQTEAGAAEDAPVAAEGGEDVAATGEADTAPEEAAEGESPPARAAPPQYIRVFVPQLVSKLHVSLGLLPEELASSRSFYFIRTRPGRLEYEELESGLDLGMLGEGPSLRMLEQTLSHVFMPMLVQMTGGGEADHRGAADAGGGGGALMAPGTGQRHRELLGNMQKFLSQVSHALQQLNGDVALPVSVGECGGGGCCSS